MSIAQLIAKTLCDLRKKRSLTQEELARHAGLSTRFYQDIEAGKKMASVASIFKLATALSTTPEDILRNPWEDHLKQQ